MALGTLGNRYNKTSVIQTELEGGDQAPERAAVFSSFTRASCQVRYVFPIGRARICPPFMGTIVSLASVVNSTWTTPLSQDRHPSDITFHMYTQELKSLKAGSVDQRSAPIHFFAFTLVSTLAEPCHYVASILLPTSTPSQSYVRSDCLQGYSRGLSPIVRRQCPTESGNASGFRDKSPGVPHDASEFPVDSGGKERP